MENKHGIGWATGMLREGACVSREGWNGKGMYLQEVLPHGKVEGADGCNHELDFKPFVILKTPVGISVPFCANQMDLLAIDWGLGTEHDVEQYEGIVMPEVTGTLQDNLTQGNIGWAIKQMLHGKMLRRRGWNGKGQRIGIQQPMHNSDMTLPYVYHLTVQKEMVPWLCSQADLMANDFQITGFNTTADKE